MWLIFLIGSIETGLRNSRQGVSLKYLLGLPDRAFPDLGFTLKLQWKSEPVHESGGCAANHWCTIGVTCKKRAALNALLPPEKTI
jgi:hypothetical protein